MNHDAPSFRSEWLAALAVFVLADSTGAFMRFGAIHGMLGLQFTNLRHAHSHLMYFGWATPALMALIAAGLPRLTHRPVSPRFRLAIWLTIAAGLLAYVPFLLYGYRPAVIAGRALPLSVMAAGLNVLTWYGFAWLYWRHTRGVARRRALRLWDTAVLFLIASTLGAAGLPAMTFLGIQNAFWNAAFTHVFLDLFSEGWFVLALLGVIVAAHPAAARHPWSATGHDLLVVGLPLIFLLYMPLHVVPAGLRWVASLGGLLAAAGLLLYVAVLWRAAGKAWRVPLAFLALKAVAQLGLLLPAVARWSELVGLRVSYLHWLLLGVISVGLVTAAQAHWGVVSARGRRAFAGAVLLLVGTLLPLTQLWPASAVIAAWS
ncbi:MAG: hypothetical protein KC425_03725 [Anaerolineales bacterium]|nr:hypothetical protein [Anaerolineales bacterium]